MDYNRTLDSDRTYIIAEIGGNFTCVDEAKMMIDEAAQSGCDAVKLQTYRADTLVCKSAKFCFEATGNTNQYELFKELEIGEDTHREVFNYAKERGLDVFSTPSHISDVELLERLDCPIYKIGSDDATNIPFLREVAKTGKPLILATGMCTLDEVKCSVDAVLAEGCKSLALLHAISLYPTHPQDVNLNAMLTMKEEFSPIPVGYSDHTIGLTACVCAAAMGAKIIEKHFTYDKNAKGPDHIHSSDLDEMKRLVSMIRQLEIMRGDGIKKPALKECESRIHNRKSMVLNRDVREGDRVEKELFEIKRPGTGILPKDIDYAIGRRFAHDMQADTVVTWEDLS